MTAPDQVRALAADKAARWVRHVHPYVWRALLAEAAADLAHPRIAQAPEPCPECETTGRNCVTHRNGPSRSDGPCIGPSRPPGPVRPATGSGTATPRSER